MKIETVGNTQNQNGPRRPFFCHIATALSGLALLIQVTAVSAVQYTYTANIGLSQIRDDNIGLRTSGDQSVFGQRLNSDASLAFTTDRNNGTLSATITENRLSDHKEYEANSKSLNATDDINFEQGHWGFNGGYLESSTLSEGEKSGQAVSVNQGQAQNNLGTQLSYNVTQRLTPYVQIDWTAVDYAAQALTAYHDYDRTVTTAGIQYSLSEKTLLSISGYSDTLNQSASNLVATTDAATLTSKIKLSETFSLSLKTGKRRTATTISSINQPVHFATNGRLFSLDISDKLNSWEWQLSASEDLTPRFNAVLDKTQKTEAALGYTYSEKWRWDSSVSRIKRTPESTYYQEYATDYLTLVNSISWMPREKIRVQAQYRYINQQITDLQSNAYSNYLGITVGWHFDHKN